MALIPNDWKHLLRTETSQKSLLRIFCYNNKVTWNKRTSKNSLIKKFTSAFNLSNSAKYNKFSNFISWPNFLEERHILSPDIWTFCGRLDKC